MSSSSAMAFHDSSPAVKKVVIIGGSYGGISTAHYLLRHAIPALSNRARYQIVLISASSQAICRPACPRALISDNLFPQDRLFVDVAKQFEHYPDGSFRFLHGKVTKLDHLRRTVAMVSRDGDTVEVEFHSLVIATGASTLSPLLGLVHDEKVLRVAWNDFRKALVHAKSIVIAGGGPTGVETAGELGEHLNGRAGWFSAELNHPKVSITLVNGGERILPQLRKSIGTKAESYLAQVGVNVLSGARILNTVPEDAGTANVATRATLNLSDGKTLEADLYIPAIGTHPNTSFVSEALLESSGLIKTNPSTLRVDEAGPHVYAIGDCSSYANPAIHQILAAVPVICANIKRDLLLAAGADEASIGKDRMFEEDTRETQLVPIGKFKGVGAAMGWPIPSLMVWAIKGRDYWLWITGNLWNGKQWAKQP